MPKVHFVKQDITVECPVGTNLRQLALAHDIDLDTFPHNLGHFRALGLCGCRVKVDDPRALSARTAADERKTAWEGPQYRLACQSKVLADIQVITNPRKAHGWTTHPTYQWMTKEPF
jgi:ferredoxin